MRACTEFLKNICRRGEPRSRLKIIRRLADCLYGEPTEPKFFTAMAMSTLSRRLRFTIYSAFAALLLVGGSIRAQEDVEAVEDMTAKYHFLSADDTLAVLDEEGRLKGYIEVSQPEEESDDVLTFDIIDGSREKSHVKFRTNKIHGKYYRFTGTVERGKGHEEKDADYLRLTGDLDIVRVNSDTGKETVQTVRVNLKSFGKSERPED
jgi:hypothetical protein